MVTRETLRHYCSLIENALQKEDTEDLGRIFAALVLDRIAFRTYLTNGAVATVRNIELTFGGERVTLPILNTISISI